MKSTDIYGSPSASPCARGANSAAALLPTVLGCLRRRLLLLALLVAGTFVGANAQVAVKTNLLYDALTTPNVGVELGLRPKNTLQLFFGLNPWTLGSDATGDRYAKHWLLMPEYRWWTCSRFNGHFFGVNAFGGQMNFSNIDFPFPGAFFGGKNLGSAVKDERFQGGYFGVGVAYGYQWSLSRHWGIEAEIGIGYGHIIYDRYPCTNCGRKISHGHSNYVGATKVALSVIYVL